MDFPRPVIENVGNILTSFHPETREEKIAFYNAISTPAINLSDVLDQPIQFSHFYVEIIKMSVNNNESVSPRVILIGNQNYSCNSFGVYSCLQRLVSVFGEPTTWDEPLTVCVKRVKSKNGFTLTLELIS